MDWSSVKGIVSKAAPLLGTALGGPAGAAIGGLISSALGVDNSPDAVASELKDNPDALLKLKQLQADHQEKLIQLHLDAESSRLSQINQTMRAEAAATDAYVRRWRPTYGYATCLTWVLESAAIVAAIVAASFIYPAQADKILGGVTALMGALTAMWGIALSVLGVNITSRSQDKQVAAGQTPGPGLLKALAQRIAGAKSAPSKPAASGSGSSTDSENLH